MSENILQYRIAKIKRLQEQHFDVLIIGGGITGAGIALDAVSRGLSVALVEMQDFSAGTSSRSTKLIHGGLRYLKQLEFKLVAEVGKEREIIHSNAPHLTKPEKMLLPIVKGGSLGKFSTRIAMWIYEKLAGVKKEEWHKVLSKEETSEAEPLLNKENLLGGILFYEYRTDDARLTIEIIKEASKRGAVALNYIKAIECLYEKNKICGMKVRDELSGQEFEIKAKHVVNACGPMVDELDRLERVKEADKLVITKGVHIVIDHLNFPCKQALYFDTPDKRMIFIIPREGKTYIGTTDTFYKGDLVNPKITNEDSDYLINCVNHFFTENKINTSMIESGWAGLRPLIKKFGKGPSEISRKDELFESKSGMIIIAGGKLTGYRKMAQRVVDLIADKMKAEKVVPKCQTEHIKISGGNLPTGLSYESYCSSSIEKGTRLGLKIHETESLLSRYGSGIEHIFDFIKNLQTEKHVLPAMLRAQLHYCIQDEMCVTPADFFIRRTGMMYFNIHEVRNLKKEITGYLQKMLQLDEAAKNKYTEEFEKELNLININ